MKNISARSITALILAGLLLAGTAFFCWEFATEGEAWASFGTNTHIYSNSGGGVASGSVYDRSGELLLSTGKDGRIYNDDPTVRAATLHVVGDREGNIQTGILSRYAEELLDYSALTGVYGTQSGDLEITLTLSAGLCATACEALGERSGVVGVYNYRTGELLCMASSPSFDPENRPDIESDLSGRYDGVYINRFIRGYYVPGSIFKLLTSAAAIENIDDIFTQEFYCDGSVEMDGGEVICSGVHGTLGFERALAVSCNCAFASIAEQLGAQTLTEYAVRSGLTSNISFDGLETVSGSFDLSGAADSQVAWAAIGQYNDLVNPCAYMCFVGAIANGGELVLPHVVQSASGAGGETVGVSESAGRVLDSKTCETLAVMMRNNVSVIYGEGKFPGLYVCAKSGTAEISDDVEPHATFAGFLKDEEYPLAFIVIVENGGSGSSVSGEVANAVLQKAVELLDDELK